MRKVEGMTKSERELCDACNAKLSELRRLEVRALYEVALRIQSHERANPSGLRSSLQRCGKRMAKDRTTLLRYAFVAKRVGQAELDALLLLSDGRGCPMTFWDLIQVAKLSREGRALAIAARLRARAAAVGDAGRDEGPAGEPERLIQLGE